MENLLKRNRDNLSLTDNSELPMHKLSTKKVNLLRNNIRLLWDNKQSIMKCSVVWDIENCQVKRGRSVADICESLDDLSIKHNIDIKSIYAIGNSSLFRPGLQDELLSKNIIFDETNCKKANISDVKITSKIHDITLQNPPPYTIVLISGDSDFSDTLDLLRNHGYSTILIYSNLAKISFIEKADKAISWSSLFEYVKLDYSKLFHSFVNTKPPKPLGIMKTPGSKKSMLNVRFDLDDEKSIKQNCIVYKIGSKLYDQYTIPDGLNPEVGDYVIFHDTKYHYSEWNIGVVKKLVQSNGNTRFDSIIDIVSDKKILLPKLEKIIDTNQQFLQIVQKHASAFLPKSIIILHAEMRCDGNNAIIYYLNSGRYDKIVMDSFIARIQNICKKTVYMEKKNECVFNPGCKNYFCNYYHKK